MTDTTRADALSTALCLLDTMAGEGLEHTYGNGQTIAADATVHALCSAFHLEPDAGWYRDLAAALVDDSTPPTFVAWLKRYCGQQDPARMRFSLGELAIAFNAGRETPPDADPCRNLVARIAGWTDAEADTADGRQVRKIAQRAAEGVVDVFPHTYTESQRERAKWTLVGAYPEDGLGDAVDMVAEALGMRKAGA